MKIYCEDSNGNRCYFEFFGSEKEAKKALRSFFKELIEERAIVTGGH